MKYEEVVKAVRSIPAGQFANIETAKQLKVRAANRGISVMKISHKTVRFGVEYDNMKSTKEGRADGSLPSENAGLPWGEWVPGQEKYFIQHKGKTYLRCAISPNKSKNVYLIDGKLASKEEAQALCLASEFKSGDSVPSVMAINTDSIVTIG